MQILLADMDQPLLDVVQRFLALQGYETETANNGTTCIRLLEEVQPEILILDDAIMWSDSGGVLNWISTVDNRFLHSVIVMGDTNSDSNLTDSSISVRYLVKPFGLVELLREVEMCRISQSRADKLPHLIANCRRGGA
jgi:DNA-binding response OmpR family regulator